MRSPPKLIAGVAATATALALGAWSIRAAAIRRREEALRVRSGWSDDGHDERSQGVVVPAAKLLRERP